MNIESYRSFPLVSIGIPVYNDKGFLREALDSLISQTYGNIEIIISDDGSSDGSEDICKEYATLDQRIIYIRQPKNIGISRNMRFLLDRAVGEFFMWAANDDRWDREFIALLVRALQGNPDAIVAFCPTMFIDEDSKSISEIRKFDYSGETASLRIKKLVQYFDDSFGYGLFRRTSISDVRFPVWWWINKRCAYNNIYPSLCYYLAKGDFVLCGAQPLWFNRLKNESNVNHKIPFSDKYMRGVFSFSLRKFNLVYESLMSAYRGSRSILLVIDIFPGMFYSWFLKPSFSVLKSSTYKFLKGKLDLF